MDLEKKPPNSPKKGINLSKGQDEPKKKFNLSKSAEPDSPVSYKKGTALETPPVKSKYNKAILLSILALICLVVVVWFFVFKAKSPEQINSGTQQPEKDQVANTGIAPSKAQEDANATGKTTAGTDNSQTAATSQKQPSAEAKEAKEKVAGSANQSSQAQPKNANTSTQPASKPLTQSKANLPYRKNEAYRVYQFPFGDYQYSQADPDLDKLAEVLKQSPSMKISISAYTDDIGDADFNMALSKKRAKSIQDYLVAKGIDAGRMNSQGMGISTKYGTKAENRRAEFTLSE